MRGSHEGEDIRGSRLLPRRSEKKKKKKSVENNNIIKNTKTTNINQTRTKLRTLRPRQTRAFLAATAFGKSTSIPTQSTNRNPRISCCQHPHRLISSLKETTRPKIRRVITWTLGFSNQVGRIFSK